MASSVGSPVRDRGSLKVDLGAGRGEGARQRLTHFHRLHTRVGDSQHCMINVY